MKNIKTNILALCGSALMLTACSENAWNDHLDGFEVPPVYDVTETVDYTLTSADYSSIASNATNKALAAAEGDAAVAALAAIGTDGAFATDADARKYIPALLASSSFPYFTLNDGSSLRIGYDLATNQPEEVKAINAGVRSLKLNKADYQGVWGSDDDFIEAFAPISPAAASLPGMLAAAFPDAKAGEYAVAQYNEASVNPVFGNVDDNYQPQTYLEASFAESVDPFTIDNVKLPSELSYVWNFDDRYACMKASAYVAGAAYESESWLVSPELELGSVMAPVLTFDQAVQYFASADVAALEATVQIREVGGAWTKLTVPGQPSELSWTFVASGDIDLSAWMGKKVQIGFCYKSTAAKAGTWELKNVKIADAQVTRGAMRAPAAEVPSVAKNALYVFNGTEWTVPGSMLVLQPSDYTAMGSTYGNLSGTQPQQYLPAYLEQVLPYAAEEAAEIVVYRYYDGAATAWKASQYTKVNGAWSLNKGATVDKFTRKEGAWAYNPSVEMVLPYARNTDPTYTYFMACMDWVYENVTLALYPGSAPANGTKPGPPFIDYRGNAEFYSGASAYYGNVDVRAATAVNNAPADYKGYEGMSDEQISALIKKRFVTESFPGALSKLHPDAAPVEGMEVTYTFTFMAYDSDGAKEETVVYTVTGPAKFKYRSCTWFKDGEDADF